MSTVVNMRPWHLLDMVMRMRDFDRRQLELFSGAVDVEHYAASMAVAPGVSFSIINGDGHPAVCFGVRDEAPGIGSSWVMGSDDLPRHVKTIKKVARMVYASGSYRRVQAWLEPGNEAARKFAEWCDLKFEGHCKRVAPTGADMDLYAWARGEL